MFQTATIGTFAKAPIGDTALQAKLNGSPVGCEREQPKN